MVALIGNNENSSRGGGGAAACSRRLSDGAGFKPAAPLPALRGETKDKTLKLIMILYQAIHMHSYGL
jgi:hypothetical protein